MNKRQMQLPAPQAGQALRVVIFTGRFGMGHCAAAEALR